ncbi:chloride channel protein [Bradyrhizobium sp. WYCCWR 13022]|uniref:chloride channel protein n=1 Tax=unclassified Bradyrhizobium TaxID=2631580 RepID=UPI00263A81C9|nr:chloride channel protein [Bradyrhizobium sp. WYCCWR 13022]MDN4986263.1 chloride channel protein [Bradyrhizobium sp. WYCCWR 13022]
MPSVLTYGARKVLIGGRVNSSAEKRKVSLLALCGLALVIGVMTGLGAVGFRALISLVHNLSYKGALSIVYDANISEGPSPFGAYVFFAPVIGGLIVVFLVRRFAPEAKGHGVPEVMDAIFYKCGKIRGSVALVKALASAVSIGSGAAAGREGPIIQIGSALGSAFAQLIGLSTRQRITLLSAGAGAGIAATFNTPLGGVLFALEILLPEVSNRTFLPVVVATGAATTIGRVLIGPDPAFAVPDVQFSMVASFNGQEAIAFVMLGVISGAAAWAFIRLLMFMEDGFPRLSKNEYVQNVIGMSSVGLMMVLLTHTFGHSYIDGVGYSVIQEILDHKMTAAGLLALLFVLKLLATTVSLGCGASGGIFSPSLYLGATLGAAFAAASSSILPHSGLTPSSAAIVGMAAIVGAGTGGVMTAIVMVFEMTRDYAIIVPVIVAVALAAAVRRALVNETIYTAKLRHRGHRIPKERHINLYLVKQAQDIMEKRFIVARVGTTLEQAMAAEDIDNALPIVVEREGRIVGLIPPRSGLRPESQSNPALVVEQFVERRMVICRDQDLLSLVFARLKRHRAGAAIVVRSASRPRVSDIAGVLTKRVIADAVIDSYED